MPYPIISKAEARSYLLGGASATLPDARFSDDGTQEDWEHIGAELSARLLQSLERHRLASGEIDGAAFESEAAPIVHDILPEHHPALGNSEFWTWLAVFHGMEVIDQRYSGSEKRNPKNFGIGGSSENLLYRLWLRGDIAFNSELSDHYELARLGDIDFWRSHVFRQGYGDVRTFARALLGFQFPEEGGGVARLKISQIRELAKQLKRARSNLMFEVMSEVRATQFIESEWERLASDIS